MGNGVYLRKAFWFAVIGLSGYYLYRAVLFRFWIEGIGETFWNKQFWFVFHVLSAVVPLATGPLQFWNGLRRKYPAFHRRIGRMYLGGSLLGGVSAFYLGMTQPYQGSILPVMILAVLWVLSLVLAWVAIKGRNIVAHRLFMIRSYVLGMTFVSLRILSDLVEHLNILFFIDNTEVKDTTYEWMSWVIPLVITEILISWLPSMKKGTPSKPVSAKTLSDKEVVY
jgi:uncharacterized membrane protein